MLGGENDAAAASLRSYPPAWRGRRVGSRGFGDAGSRFGLVDAGSSSILTCPRFVRYGGLRGGVEVVSAEARAALVGIWLLLVGSGAVPAERGENRRCWRADERARHDGELGVGVARGAPFAARPPKVEVETSAACEDSRLHTAAIIRGESRAWRSAERGFRISSKRITGYARPTRRATRIFSRESVF